MSDHAPGVLRVDLSERRVRREPVPEPWRREFIGGKGLGARYLYDELEPGMDPLGPKNRLLFLVGPLTGRLPGEPRYAAVTKSPLTGTFLDSYAGGTFPGALAGALDGNLGLVVHGVADEPVRIEVEEGDATIHAADEWGADTAEMATAFPDATVACIGPAGEQQVAYATIASDGGEHHAGRGGAGAVMGAKGLKAVVARGEPPAGLEALRDEYEERFREADVGRWLAASDTVESVDFADRVGALATRGWTGDRFEGAEDVGVEAVRDAAEGRERDGEAVPGGFRVDTEEGESVPRGATAMSLGAGLGVDDFDAVAALGERCNRAGLDVISAGSAVAWAIRAGQEGVVDLSLEFGDHAGARGLIDDIVARRTDLGDALADGVDAAAERFGGHGLVPTVKAMELPAYDPRGATSMALAYATSDRGACHRRARPVEQEPFDGPWDPDRAAEAVISEQDRRSVLWSLIVDDFAGDVFADLGAEWLAAVGLDYEPEELRLAGERVWTLTRLFNVREGLTREDDALPSMLREAAGGEGHGGVDVDRFSAMLDAYYARRGWGPDGRPTRETVERVGLGDIVDAETPLAAEAAVFEPTDAA